MDVQKLLKHKLHLFLVIIFLQACNSSMMPWKDTPTEGKRIISIGDYNSGTPTTTVKDTSITAITANANVNINANTSTTTASATEFSHCVLNPPKYNFKNKLIGSFNVCQSSDKSTKKIIFQNKANIRDYKLCFYPINISTNSNANFESKSVMIGDEKCIYPVVAEKVFEIEFTINREGFTDKTFNGVMIIKDMPYGEVTPYHNNMKEVEPTYVIAYKDCMKYLDKTGDDVACKRFLNKKQYILISFL
ncbi:MAG: hypothetical protein HQK51_00105 [Oligoflexia bacterium]|nr:hypothetical protein [Oligoflexia bacterium]